MNLRLSLISILIILLFSYNLSTAQSNTGSTSSQNKELSLSRFIISVNGGLGYLTGNTKNMKAQMRSFGVSESDINQYVNDYKLGEFAEASVHYMINKGLGFGIDYNVFTTSGQVKGYLDPGDGWTKYYGVFSDKVYTNFVGASCLSRAELGKGWGYYNKLSLGMAFYRDEMSVINTPFLVTGKAFAMYGEFGLTYSISKHISINAGLSYFVSTLGKIKSDNGTDVAETKLDKDSKENLSRLNLSTGLLFKF